MACYTIANNNKLNTKYSTRHINMKNGKSFMLKAKGSGTEVTVCVLVQQVYGKKDPSLNIISIKSTCGQQQSSIICNIT